MAKALSTPKGEAVYPRVTKADFKYKKEGEYHLKVKFDSDLPEVQGFIAKIDTWFDEAQVKAVKDVMAAFEEKNSKPMKEAAAQKQVKPAPKPYTFVTDEDGEDTNIIEINFKMLASATDRKTNKVYYMQPVIVGGGNKILEGDAIPRIYSGSIVRVGYKPIMWYTKQLGAGVRLRLSLLKLLKVVSSSDNADDTFGDDDDEGYVAAPTAQTAAAEAFGGDNDPGTGQDDDADGDF